MIRLQSGRNNVAANLDGKSRQILQRGRKEPSAAPLAAYRPAPLQRRPVRAPSLRETPEKRLLNRNRQCS